MSKIFTQTIKIKKIAEEEAAREKQREQAKKNLLESLEGGASNGGGLTGGSGSGSGSGSTGSSGNGSGGGSGEKETSGGLDGGASGSDTGKLGAGEVREEKSFFPDGLDVNTKANNPFEELEKIDEFYRNKAGADEGLGLKELDEPIDTREDIEKRVTASADAKYDKLKKAEQEKFDENVRASEKSKSQAQNNFAASESKINSYYDASVTAAENQALKRGLARSSIIIGQLDGIEKSRASELSSSAANLAKTLSDIDANLNSLEAKRNSALESLDLEYASEVQTEIEKAVSDLNKKKQEVIDFNNKVKQLEGEYGLKKEKQEASIKQAENEFRLKNGMDVDAGYDDATRTKMMFCLEYLNGMKRADALKKLTSDNMFAYYLGNAWLDVYNMQAARPLNS